MHLVIKLPILIIRNITQRINIFYAKRISFCLRRNSKFASKHLNIYKENKRTLWIIINCIIIKRIIRYEIREYLVKNWITNVLAKEENKFNIRICF